MQRLQLLFVDTYQQINKDTCLQHNYLQASDFSMPKIHILVLGQDSKYEEHNSNIIEADSALCSKGAISPAKLDILECRHPMKRAALTPSPEQEMLIISYTPSHNARHPGRNIPPDKMGEEWKTETQCADGKWAHHFTQIITRA